MDQTWFVVRTAATYANRTPYVILEALRVGELRGYQKKAGGKWDIHRDDLDHWIMGGSAETAPTTRPRSNTAPLRAVRG